MNSLHRLRPALSGCVALWAAACADAPHAATQPNAAAADPPETATARGATVPARAGNGDATMSAGEPPPIETVPVLDASMPRSLVGDDASSRSAAPDFSTSIDGALGAHADDPRSDSGMTPPVRGNWPSFGGNYEHTRTNLAETRISRSSVRGLQRAWERAAPGVSATPAILDGVVYWSDWVGGVHASRVVDGAELWSRQLPVGFSSSPFVSETSIYLADRNHTIHALDRETGQQLWATALDDVALTDLWSSPIVVDGILVVGSSGVGTMDNGEAFSDEELASSRGAVVGLNAHDGEVVWRFETTRVAGDPVLYGPGVSVWSSAAIDTTRGLLFIGTGNGYAQPVSPYSNALLVLEYRTGELAWHRQFTPDDAFHAGDLLAGPDYDVGAAPNMFTIQYEGRALDVVGVGDKAGVYHVLARDSGAPIWERVLDPVDFLRKTGGIIAPAAYADGRVFVASNTSHETSKVWALDATTGAVSWESQTIESVNFGGPAVANGVLFFGGSGLSILGSALTGSGVGGVGEIIAFDTGSGEVLYRSALRAGRGGGYAIADGRVFVGTGFSFYVSNDEPVKGFLEVFAAP